jgi:trk system potassium uptake protein
MRLVRSFPAFPALLLAAAALMLIPAIHAAQIGAWRIARTFFYHAIFLAIIATLIGIATVNRRPRRAERYQLLTLLLAYLLLPAALALPLHASTQVDFAGAYFEMVSSLTTTGATIYDRPWLLAEPLHLWRALVGWAGGLMILVAAFAVLAPLNLGGFEVARAGGEGGHESPSIDAARERIHRALRIVGPTYVLATAALALLLAIAGDRPIVAICHAMATLSTSGISPLSGGPAMARSGFVGEILIAVLLLSAVTHRLLLVRLRRERLAALVTPEVQLMLICVLGVTVVLFLRAFIGAIEADRQADLLAAAQAAWGGLFTVLAHLTTAGFESQYWLTMQVWSRLDAPGIILLGVAAMGGGIATTAGGIKLLRLYALYRHGLRELDLLVHPSSPGRRTAGGAFITENGARIAFVFLMLFLVTLAVTMIALSASGLPFERSLTVAVAALSTTGPAIATLGDGTTYADLPGTARTILCVAMIIGRMEALVIVALLNPAYWRK